MLLGDSDGGPQGPYIVDKCPLAISEGVKKYNVS